MYRIHSMALSLTFQSGPSADSLAPPHERQPRYAGFLGSAAEARTLRTQAALPTPVCLCRSVDSRSSAEGKAREWVRRVLDRVRNACGSEL